MIYCKLLLFLICLNDMPMTVKCNLFLYSNDTCLVFQYKNVTYIEKQFNENFSNKCNWLVDNKVSIHFDKDKTKSILFGSKLKVKIKVETIYNNIRIK